MRSTLILIRCSAPPVHLLFCNHHNKFVFWKRKKNVSYSLSYLPIPLCHSRCCYFLLNRSSPSASIANKASWIRSWRLRFQYLSLAKIFSMQNACAHVFMWFYTFLVESWGLSYLLRFGNVFLVTKQKLRLQYQIDVTCERKCFMDVI